MWSPILFHFELEKFPTAELMQPYIAVLFSFQCHANCQISYDNMIADRPLSVLVGLRVFPLTFPLMRLDLEVALECSSHIPPHETGADRPSSVPVSLGISFSHSLS